MATPQTLPGAPQPQQAPGLAAPAPGTPGSPTACEALRTQSARSIAARDYPAASATLQQALAVCGNRQAVLLSLANTQMLAKQFDASAHTLSLLLADDPKNMQALLVQGELDYLIGASAQAIASLTQASALAPKDAQPHYLLGRVYYEQSDIKQAQYQFQQALQLDPDAYKAWDGLALCYETQGDTALAAQTYMRGIQLVYKAHPEYDVIYADFAELMLRFNKSEKALELAAEAAHRNPHAARNYLLAGRALDQLGKYQDSVRWLQRSSEVDPSLPDPHFQLARIYRKLGDAQQAKQQSDLYAQLAAKAPAVRR